MPPDCGRIPLPHGSRRRFCRHWQRTANWIPASLAPGVVALGRLAANWIPVGVSCGFLVDCPALDLPWLPLRINPLLRLAGAYLPAQRHPPLRRWQPRRGQCGQVGFPGTGVGCHDAGYQQGRRARGSGLLQRGLARLADASDCRVPYAGPRLLALPRLPLCCSPLGANEACAPPQDRPAGVRFPRRRQPGTSHQKGSQGVPLFAEAGHFRDTSRSTASWSSMSRRLSATGIPSSRRSCFRSHSISPGR
jgi:hypothetical protein